MKLINLFWRILKKNIHFWNKEILLHFTISIYRRTIRRLTVKVDSWPVVRELRSVQLRVSTSGGCEAAAHAARCYIRDCRHRSILLNIDMRNTFNSLRRETFLSVARVRTRGFYNLLWQAYSSQTRSFFGEEGFASETGIQQGAPIGPAFFALSVDEAARGVQTELNVRYFDDLTMLPSENTWRGFTTIWWYYRRGSEQLAWRSMGANVSYATRQCVQYSLSL